MTQVENKPPIDEVMAHFGVRGMRWGVTTPESSGGSGGGKPKAAKKPKPTSDDIKAARLRQVSRELRYEGAVGDYMVARTRKGTDAAEKTMRKMEKEMYLGKDAKTASRMTKGEKIGVGLTYGVTGAIFAATIIAAARQK